jgi:thiol-disulfide isomerase/thioredoxin
VKSRARSLALGLVCAGLACLTVTDGRSAPDPEPVFSTTTLERTDGQEVSFESLRGRVVVVNFWASWCKPCRKELPVLQQWHDELRDREVEFLAISVDHDAGKMERFVRREGLTLPVVHDGPHGLAKRLDLPYLPCTYVLDQNGKVALVSEGSDREGLREIHDRIQELTREPRRAQASMGSNSGEITP